MDVVDTHHHVLPPRFVELWHAHPHLSMGFKLPPWEPAKTLDFMARHRVARAVVSLAHPMDIFKLPAEDVASLCREMNQYMAAFRDSDPAKFGFFAALPAPSETDACVQEIRHAMTTLRADGVILFTSHEGTYLGDDTFRPVWHELHAHKAIAFIHPGMDRGSDCIRTPRLLPRPLIDWTHETARVAAHLIAADIMRDFAACKVILSHAGGTLPFTFHRFAELATVRFLNKSTDQMLAEARQFYFDVALSVFEGPFRLLEEFAGKDRLLYGSDYPFVQPDFVARQRDLLDKLVEEDAPIRQKNAQRILAPVETSDQ